MNLQYDLSNSSAPPCSSQNKRFELQSNNNSVTGFVIYREKKKKRTLDECKCDYVHTHTAYAEITLYSIQFDYEKSLRFSF